VTDTEISALVINLLIALATMFAAVAAWRAA
jgi:hypothetical protein